MSLPPQPVVPSTLDQIFEQQVVATPDATALVWGTQRWTYQELNRHANYIAQRLRAQGVGPDQLVVLVAERSAQTIAAILGILKAGGAYLPLSPADPDARIAGFIEEAKPTVVLTEAKFASAISTTVPVLVLDGLQGESDTAPSPLAAAHNLCYVMFSSGSSGKPKGVMVEHRSVVRLVKGADYADFSPEHVFLHFAPLAFDASTFEIWGALLNGGSLVILPQAATSLRDLASALRDHKITTAWLTSGLFNAMVEQECAALAGLQQLLTGGDIVSPAHARRLLDAGPQLRLINGYGPTEATTFACCYTIPANHPSHLRIPIGRPIAKTTVYITDLQLRLVPAGEAGEICIAGDGVARGYLNDPGLTQKHFIDDPFSGIPGAKLYRSGDLGRIDPDGIVEFLGRDDSQLKLRGFRVDLAEIENTLLALPGVTQAAVMACNTSGTEKQLAAFVVAKNFAASTARAELGKTLPAYAVPAHILSVDALPLNANGKVDRLSLLRRLTESASPPAKGADVAAQIAGIWSAILGCAVHDFGCPFFELGGSSLQFMSAHAELEKCFGRNLAIADLFRYPTVNGLAQFLIGAPTQDRPASNTPSDSRDIAIIGMAGRFPGARNIREFWNNLCNGVESTTFFESHELEVPGSADAVRAKPILAGAEMFDAAYFGILPTEAALIDPQQRVFLECCVEALNDAGCDPTRDRRPIGVFGGSSPNTYFLHHVCAQPGFVESYTSEFQVGNYAAMLGTSADFLATRVAHKLNLTGPAITSGTACSTSLVTVAQACESLLSGSCDAALAGGASITYPQRRGYQYQDGGIVSPDGHCRAFDQDAQGTIFGSGCGVVLLKRLQASLADGDHIYAVIRGVGINNDGSNKAGFTAPSVRGQAAAIRRAHQIAGVDPETITYIEAHGTATPLGDPIEVAALTEAFRASTERKQFCAIGTAKTNIGHLDAAAGVTGLIKTALSIEHGILPPALHYREPNPRIDFANSPFYVVNQLTEWNPQNHPRRAGVSSFGVGGTNVHVVLEQAPTPPERPAESLPQVLTLSAKTETALNEMSNALADQLAAKPQMQLSDAAFTLQTGRSPMAYRRAIICSDRQKAIESLREQRPATQAQTNPKILFAFPGQGAQRAGMGHELYQNFPAYQAAFDACADLFQAHLKEDLRAVLFTDFGHDKLANTSYAQPALFATSYALTQLWKSWGVQPHAMIGHSIGEFVAACQAGVFTLEQAVEVIALRGQLMQSLPGGSMLAIQLSEADLLPRLSSGLALAAVNGPMACTVAGEEPLIAELEAQLTREEIASRRLRTSHAFHSPMMQPVINPLVERISAMHLGTPAIPFLSTLTGNWITDVQATDPMHWARHCAETVRFSEALRAAQQRHAWVTVEAGPGRTLTALALHHGHKPNPLHPISSLGDASSEVHSVLNALGRIWTAGVACDWAALHTVNARKISLPGYPFEKVRHCIERPAPHKDNTAPIKDQVSMEVTQPSTAIHDELVRLFEDLSGLDLQSAPQGASFVELGFDSLFLTQVNQKINIRYKIKLRFTELLGDLNTFNALAARLAQLAPAATPAVAPALPVAVAGNASTSSPSSMERLLQQQLQAFQELMTQQLAAVRGMDRRADTAAVMPAAKQEAFGPFRPLQKTPSAESREQTGEQTNEQQERYLRAFVTRYSRRTAESKRQTQQHRATLADPRVVSGFRSQWKDVIYPISVARSEGARLWDVDGNEYIDIQNGFGVTLFGHSPKFVRDAVQAQLELGWEIGPQTPLAGRVAALLCELTGNDRATFCNTGSEAVMAALRLARTVTGRGKIVYFTGDYHGGFDEVLLRRAGNSARPIAPGIPTETATNVLVLDYGTEESLATIRAQADSIAAVLVEPVQSRHPALQPKAYLQHLRQLTEQAGIALIFDEVVTGFRAHIGGAQAWFDVRADLVTYGKVVGGGLPIGVLAGKAQFMDALDGGPWQFGDASMPETGVTFFAGTFVRHPLAMAAAWAVLNHLQQAGPQLQEELNHKTTSLVERLNQMFADAALSVKCEHFASLFYFTFPAEQRFAPLFYAHMRLRGIHILEGFPCFLTTAHTAQDLDQIVAAFRDSVADMQSGGLLPAPPRSLPTAFECPLTEAQMEIRLSAQLGDEESCAFNEGFTLNFDGALNAAALSAALQSVFARHEALRSTLHLSGDRLLIHPSLAVPLTSDDLSCWTPVEQTQRVTELKEREAWKVFDLVAGPLVRTHLVKLAAERHVLLITAHHIICDGWSIGVLLDEISSGYNALCAGKPVGLPAPLPFHEYAQTAAGQTDPAVEEYWVSQFAEPAPTLELPTDRPRPLIKSNHGATFVSEFSGDFREQIQKAGAQHGCTPFVTLLAGFELLLRKLSGQSDIVIGIPSAGQADVADRALVGHCVNFLPIRVQTDPAAPFLSLLTETRNQLLAAKDHGTYTYGTLLRKLAIPRTPGRLPLIEVQFNLERTGADLSFNGLRATMEQNQKRFVTFDLFFNLVETAHGLRLHCDYNTDLFDETTIADWVRQYESLLTTACLDMNRPLVHLAVAQQPTNAFELRGSSLAVPEECAHQLFARQAQLRPNATAIRCGTQTISYQELNRRANQLAHWLQTHGAASGALIGISLDPSIEMVIAVLAVLKTGAAYLPLDPSLPVERLSYICEDAQALLVLDQHNWPNLNDNSSGELPAVALNQLAYVIYTSGSTGKPKGVQIEHRSLTNFLWSMKQTPGLTSSDRLLAVTTLSFDIAGLELFLPLICGAEIVIAPSEAKTDGRVLAQLIEDASVTVMQATPTTWKMLLAANWQGSPGLKMLCGGEELTRDLAGRLLPCGAALWNMYGPTETTIWSSAARITASAGPISIGAPIANTSFFVMNQHGQPVAGAAVGELYIAGVGLARGYHRRDELTKERFVTLFGQRLYRTGDLARSLGDGTLTCLGRLDRQVKIRGHRIELGEIEEALLSHPAVRDAAVLVREDQPANKDDKADKGDKADKYDKDDKRLVAYVVDSGLPADEKVLRADLARTLPVYMLPNHFVKLPVMPLTSNGKIDRLALSKLPPPNATGATTGEHRQPATASERTLCRIIQDVVGAPHVTLDDDFFALGGDSIHLFQVAARAAREGLSITPKQLLHHRTIALTLAAAARETGQISQPMGITALRREALRKDF